MNGVAEVRGSTTGRASAPLPRSPSPAAKAIAPTATSASRRRRRREKKVLEEAWTKGWCSRALVVVSLGRVVRNEACEVVEGAATPCAVRERAVWGPTTNAGSGVTMCRDVGHEQDPNGYPAEGCARPYRRSRSRRRDRRHRRGFGCGDPTSPVGQPPPEWAANAGAWPAHNHDLANTRATTQSPINSQTVSKLKVKWRFPLQGRRPFGVFASTPIVLNGTVYLQDLNSNVYALDRRPARSSGGTRSTAEHRTERRRLRLRAALRRDRDERLRARPADRQAWSGPAS